MRDILRRGRLSSDVDRETAKFTSSPEVDEWIFDSAILVNRAHVVMLCEQGIISKADCSTILKALDGIKKEGTTGINLAYEDVHMALESKLIESIGEDVGGRMHTAKSRNDEVATCIRIALRGELLGLMHELNELRQVLIKLAESHTETIMPGFTHLQHAQPTTFAHHLIAYVDALERDFDRLCDAYARVNLCPLGAAAFASTGFPINRERTAQLLGFDDLVENSMDAVSTRDFAIECMSAFSNIMTNLSRIAEELILWSTPEFDFIELDDRYASTSSIMPQKKNPDVLELIRAKAGSTYGALMSALTICKALPYSYNRDLQEVTPHLLRAIAMTRASSRMVADVVDTMQVKVDVMRDKAEMGFTTATELADTIVREAGVSFRTAHQIVGTLTKKGGRTLKHIDAISEKVIGKRLSELGLSQKSVDVALDVVSNVKTRKIRGGPAPEETVRMIKSRKESITGNIKNLKGKTETAFTCHKKLDVAVGKLGVHK
ncbi:MAG: argininosuccinate lyase [Methanosarcinales archaeon Met12]|nr:MAG: argininosuccinate lyase [Methanosarcinales archaeon Met12]